MAVKKETTKGTTSLKKRVAAKKTTVKETKEVTVLNPTELALSRIKKERMYVLWTLQV